MMVAAHPAGSGLQPPGPPSAGAPSEPLLGPLAGLVLAASLALAAAVVLIQTRPAELRALPATLPSTAAPPSSGTAVAPVPSAGPVVAPPRPGFRPPDLHPTPPRVPALGGPRPAGPPPLSYDLSRPLERHPLPPPPPAGGGGALQGVYGTQPACAQCGWVEAVQPLATGSGGLPAGAAVAAGAALGAQAGAAYGTGNARAGSRAGPGAAASAAAGAVLGAEAATRQGAGSGRPPRNGYEIHVRMEDGSPRVFEQAEPLPLGAAVVVEGGVLRLAPSRASTGTSTPSGGKVYGTD